MLLSLIFLIQDCLASPLLRARPAGAPAIARPRMAPVLRAAPNRIPPSDLKRVEPFYLTEEGLRNSGYLMAINATARRITSGRPGSYCADTCTELDVIKVLQKAAFESRNREFAATALRRLIEIDGGEFIEATEAPVAADMEQFADGLVEAILQSAVPGMKLSVNKLKDPKYVDQVADSLLDSIPGQVSKFVSPDLAPFAAAMTSYLKDLKLNATQSPENVIDVLIEGGDEAAVVENALAPLVYGDSKDLLVFVFIDARVSSSSMDKKYFEPKYYRWNSKGYFVTKEEYGIPRVIKVKMGDDLDETLSRMMVALTRDACKKSVCFPEMFKVPFAMQQRIQKQINGE